MNALANALAAGALLLLAGWLAVSLHCGIEILARGILGVIVDQL